MKNYLILIVITITHLGSAQESSWVTEALIATEKEHYLWKSDKVYGDEKLLPSDYYMNGTVSPTILERLGYDQYVKQYSYTSSRYFIPANSFSAIAFKPQNLNTERDEMLIVYIVDWSKSRIKNLSNYSFVLGTMPDGLVTLIEADDNDIHRRVIPPVNFDRDISIYINSIADADIEFCIAQNEINLAKEFGKACIQAGFDYLIEDFIDAIVEDSPAKDQRIQEIRMAANVVFEILTSTNLSSSINQIMIDSMIQKIRNELGFGFWGDVTINYVKNIINRIEYNAKYCE